MSRTTSDRSRRSEREPLPPGFFTIGTTVALDLVGFGMIAPILGRYAERFGASGFTIGLLFASFSLAQFVCAPLLGRLSDRIGRKPVIIISLFGTAIGSFLTGAATTLWMLFAGRLVDGASGASVAVAQGAVTDVAAPKDRPRLLGLLGAAFGVGFVLGPAIGGLAALGGPHVPFYIAGSIALVNGLIAIKRLPETRPPEARVRPATSHATAARSARLWNFAIVGFISIAAFSGFESTFSLFANRRFGLEEAGTAAVFVGVGLLLVFVQTRMIKPVGDRVGTSGSLQYGLVLNAAGMLALAASHRWLLLIPALALLTIGQGLVTPNLSATVSSHVADHQRGEALGFQQGANSVGRVVGPAVAGFLFQHVGVPAPYVVAAAMFGVALAVLVGSRRRETAIA